uniref:RNA-dependent RNA polymerase n=1 Tax=Ostrekin virus TaxID=2707248 RepID=A0A6H0DIB1_9VIRU|nr:MAG: RNA-dependent RNA polymerase [Ostrekin virus]
MPTSTLQCQKSKNGENLKERDLSAWRAGLQADSQIFDRNIELLSAIFYKRQQCLTESAISISQKSSVSESFVIPSQWEFKGTSIQGLASLVSRVRVTLPYDGHALKGEECDMISGFTCRGKFKRQGTQAYVSSMNTPVSTPYVDSVMMSVLKSQGFNPAIKPRNLYDPTLMKPAVERFSQPDVRLPRDDSVEYARQCTFDVFARPQQIPYLAPLEESQLQKALKLSASAGVPYDSKAKCLAFLDAYRREVQVREGVKAPNPCTMYKRTGPNGKVRPIWGYPLDMTIMEARFARPLIDHFSKVTTPYVIGRTPWAISTRVTTMRDSRGTTYSLDYSKFDSSISSDLIRLAFEVLATWFDPKVRKDLGWDIILRYFICTPFIFIDGKLYTGKRKGVPSGSYFTSIVDSIVNFFALNYLAHKCGRSLDYSKVMIMGDDSIFVLPGRGVKLEFMERVLSSLGIKLNVEKSGINNYHFLGAVRKTGLPSLDTEEMLEKLVCPERSRHQFYKGLSFQGKRTAAISLLALYPYYEAEAVLRRFFRRDLLWWVFSIGLADRSQPIPITSGPAAATARMRGEELIFGTSRVSRLRAYF